MKLLNFLIGTVAVLVFIQPEETVSMPVRLLVFLVGGGLLALLDYLQRRREKRENDAKPLTSIPARVTDRRSIMVGKGRYRRKAYYLTFTTEDGSMHEFEVSELEFSRLGMGESGTLEFRGWEYLGLRRYDLGDVEPVAAPDVQAERPADAAVRKVEGVLTHELEP